MKQYSDLINQIISYGNDKKDRTGTGTKSIFGYQMRFDLEKGFPLVTLKKTWFKGVVYELLWMISGSTNIKYLKNNNVNIWNEWADRKGELGPVYGKQWRSWDTADNTTIDQLDQVIESIKTNPDSRRHIVTAWNPGDVDKMKLPPCHMMFQFYVYEGKLSCQLYQRSADVFLGVPFNIASYALLTMMVAQVTGLKAGEFIHTIGDAHLYKNHWAQSCEVISREPKALPIVVLNPKILDIDLFKFEDIVLLGYESHPSLKGDVSV